MIFKIRTKDTYKIIYRSNIRNSDDSNTLNLRLDLFYGEEPITNFNKSKSYINQDQMMMVMTPDNMRGHTFLGEVRYYGEKNCARIVKTRFNP